MHGITACNEKRRIMKFHLDGNIPDDGSIFVFGSNLAGRHGKGAALVAKQKFGAQYGTGKGRTGMSYAIPTKDGQLRPVGLQGIRHSIGEFLWYARNTPSLAFYVTRVGCGLAGYKDSEIAPMFKSAPDNCSFAEEWRSFLEEK